jgi:hypothetical protein
VRRQEEFYGLKFSGTFYGLRPTRSIHWRLLPKVQSYICPAHSEDNYSTSVVWIFALEHVGRALLIHNDILNIQYICILLNLIHIQLTRTSAFWSESQKLFVIFAGELYTISNFVMKLLLIRLYFFLWRYSPNLGLGLLP